MAFTTIDDPSAHFQTALYTGNGGSNTITNDGNSDLQADWIWLKERGSTSSHHVFDSTRGVGGSGKALHPDTFDPEGDDTAFTSFNSDGFTLANTGGFNESGVTNVAWQWKANGGSRTTFTESGNNPGGGYQANTTAGFSIVDFTGTGGAGTVSHGLGAVPAWIIVKRRSSGNQNWIVYHHKNTSAPETERLYLDNTNATDDVTWWNDTAPTSSVFSLGATNVTNNDGSTHVAYCFAKIQGYSKFGIYTGNGNDDGPFVYTGFKPAWVLYKRTNDAGNWRILDNKRNTFNVMNNEIYADLNNAEAQDNQMDFLSNGFKLRNGSSVGQNGNGSTYIYWAFAEHPFVSSKGVPVTAR